MSSIIGYRKEFEDIILKGKLEEALKALVPNSSEKIYLQFCEEYKNKNSYLGVFSISFSFSIILT